jgi:hypothetical protein
MGRRESCCCPCPLRFFPGPGAARERKALQKTKKFALHTLVLIFILQSCSTCNLLLLDAPRKIDRERLLKRLHSLEIRLKHPRQKCYGRLPPTGDTANRRAVAQ